MNFFKNLLFNKKYEPKKYSNWILRNAFELLIIPITILAVIFGMYADIINDELLPNKSNNFKKNDYYKIDTYLSDFQKEKIRNNSIQIQNIFFDSIKSKEKTYNHMLVIDRTYSGKNPPLELKTSSFRDTLEQELINKNYPKQKLEKARSIKSLIAIDFLLEYLESKSNTREFLLAFYDGDGADDFTFRRHKNLDLGDIKWVSIKEDNPDFINNCLDEVLDVVKIDSQKTDFRKIFNNISKNAKEDMIVTIISDFDHEMNSMNSLEIDTFLGKVKKLNILYLPPNNQKKKKKSQKLIEQIKLKFKNNDFLHWGEINFDEYSSEEFDSELWEKYLFLKGEFFSLTDFSKDQIIFYYPKVNNKGDLISKSSLNVKGKSGLEWMIVDNFQNKKRFAGTVKLNGKQKSSFGYNSFYNLNNQSSKIEIDIYNEFKSNQLDFYLYDPNNKLSQSHNIIVRKIIPELVAIIGIYSLLFLKYLIILLVFSHILRSINFIKYSKYNNKISIYTIEIFFMLVSCGIALRILDNWEQILILCLAIMHLLVYIIFGLAIKKKRVQYEKTK